MQTKLYVGNLNYSTTDKDLYDLFGPYGEVRSVNLIKDKFTGQSKGFAFVEFAGADQAEKALEQNGKDFMSRSITVSEARPQKEQGFGGGRRENKFGGGGGGYGGGGGGGGKKSGGHRRQQRY